MTPADKAAEEARTVEALWGRPSPPTRGPKPSLSLERITQAAIGLADTEGLAAVSLQRIADELGFTKMALYRHMPGKPQLLAVMINHAVGEPPRLEDRSGWRAQLQEWASGMLARFRSHPWLLEATVGARVMGPNELGWLERAVAALEGTGLDGAERLDAVVVVLGHIRTVVQQTSTPPGRPPLTEEQFVSPIAELIQRHGDRFPAIARSLASVGTDARQGDALHFGLDRILDGLGMLIATRSGTDGDL